MQVNITLSPKRVRMVAAACMVLYAGAMGFNIGVSVILPRMLASIGGMEFYSFASVVSSIGIMISAPVVGRIGDAWGRKWLTIGSLAFHMALLVLVSLCRAPLLFIVLYTFSGVGVGLYISMAHAILGDILPLGERGKYYGLLSASGAAGMLSGPLAAGVIVDSGHPAAGFYVTFPLMIAAAVLLLIYYPNKPSAERMERPDMAGLLLLAAAIGCISTYINFGGSKFGRVSVTGLCLLAVGLAAGAVFFRHVRRVNNPIVDLGLFANRTFTLAWTIRLIFTAYLLCASSYLVLYAQNAMGVSATVSSTLAMPQTVCMIVLSPLIGRAVSKNMRNFRRFYLLMGICGVAALAIWSNVRPDTPLILLYGGMVIGGVSYATEQTISTPYFQLSIRPDQYGAAQGMSFFASSAGGTIWGAVYGAILAGGDIVSRIHVIFLTGMCIMVCIALIALFLVKPTVEQRVQ